MIDSHEMSTERAVENLLRRERYRDALRLAKSLPPAQAPEARALGLQARALAGLAEFDAAASAARQAITLDPACAPAYTALGEVAAMQQQPNPAVTHFSQALRADPDYAPALYGLGMVLLRWGERDQAAQALRRAAALAPGEWRYAAAMAVLEPGRRRAKALRAAYRAGLAELPGSVTLRLRLLGAYLAGALAPLAGEGAAVSRQLGVEAYRTLLARRVVVTYAILAINVLMFFWLEAHGGSQNALTDYHYGALDPAAVIHHGEWWRLFTALFLHAGPTHLLVNGISLYFVGVLYERCVGPARFLAVYLLSGLAGNILSLAVLNQDAVGASGAIFGVFGALAVYFFLQRRLFAFVAGSLIRQIAVLSVINLALPLVVSNIDGWAHLGGLLCGIASAWLAGPWLRTPQPDLPPATVLAERRPVWQVAMLLASMALVLVALAVLVIAWNPAGA